MTRTARSAAGREVVSASERLMDGLLAEEHRCFAAVTAGVGQLAEQVEAAIRRTAKAAGRRAVLVELGTMILPSDEQVAAAVLPPVGDLLATTRERTLVVVRRHLRACESAVPVRWAGTAARSVAMVRSQASALEWAWFDRAGAGILAGSALVRAAMVEQAQAWWSRTESVEELVARLCSPEPVQLPGAGRGAVWQLRARVNAEARNASVGLTNGLLLAGMAAWNELVSSAS